MLGAGLTNGNEESVNNGCPASIMLNSLNQLIIEVPETALASYEKGFALPYFKNRSSITLDDAYVIPETISKELGAISPLQINPGTYPVVYNNNAYKVTIQL
jgi:hypothetical protein